MKAFHQPAKSTSTTCTVPLSVWYFFSYYVLLCHRIGWFQLRKRLPWHTDECVDCVSYESSGQSLGVIWYILRCKISYYQPSFFLFTDTFYYYYIIWERMELEGKWWKKLVSAVFRKKQKIYYSLLPSLNSFTLAKNVQSIPGEGVNCLVDIYCNNSHSKAFGPKQDKQRLNHNT